MSKSLVIDRRRFLQVALSLPVARFQRAKAVAGAVETVVVGAGLAGLHAAGILKKAGRSVVVLEARAVPGGRVVTVRSPFDENLYAEAGPIRIAPTHRTVLSLAREHGLTVVPFESPAGASLLTVGAIRARGEALDLTRLPLDLRSDEKGLTSRALLERYVGELPAEMAVPSATWSPEWRRYDRQTWPDWLLSRGASAGAVKVMTTGGDSRELSALYVLRQFALLGQSSHFFKIRGGMDLLPKALAAALGDLVRYNVQVVRLVREAREIRLDYVENGRQQAIKARDVVVAVPFSTLREIEIRPPFSPLKRRAIAELPYYPVTRFLLQCGRRFWNSAGLNGSARTDQPAEIWDCTYDIPATRGILGATVGGTAAALTEKMTLEESVVFGKEAAARAFPELPLNFEKGVAYRWGVERWSRGAFAVCRPGQMTAFMPEMARREGRIHFAGEHTSSWMGWMEGALESGERAAREVLNGPAHPAG
jgi:monoamine oxidase